VGKLAVFVEGQTELIFLRRLIEEIGGTNNLTFREERWHAKSFITLSTEPAAGQPFFVLIVDCCSDHAVLSAILDRHASLTAANYDLILGVRDLYPSSHADLPVLIADIATYLPAGGTPIEIVVAVAEIEAWFMQENLHFPKIDPSINRASVLATLHYDIDVDHAETLPHPAASLDQAYRIGSKRYTKSKARVSRTVKWLDYEHLYLDRRPMLQSFDSFVTHLESFFGF